MSVEILLNLEKVTIEEFANELAKVVCWCVFNMKAMMVKFYILELV